MCTCICFSNFLFNEMEKNKKKINNILNENFNHEWR